MVRLRPVWMTNHPPSVLWHCWLGHQTCNNRQPYNLYCVGAQSIKALEILWLIYLLIHEYWQWTDTHIGRHYHHLNPLPMGCIGGLIIYAYMASMLRTVRECIWSGVVTCVYSGVRRQLMPSTSTWITPRGWTCMEHTCTQLSSRQVITSDVLLAWEELSSSVVWRLTDLTEHQQLTLSSKWICVCVCVWSGTTRFGTIICYRWGKILSVDSKTLGAGTGTWLDLIGPKSRCICFRWIRQQSVYCTRSAAAAFSSHSVSKCVWWSCG